MELQEDADRTLYQHDRVSNQYLALIFVLTCFSWYYANAGLNVVVDLLIAILPVRAIWRLYISVKQKIALQLILTMGWL